MATHLQDPELLDALLRHPSITQDQRTFCAILGTSKTLRAAITARCSGQLAVQLTLGSNQLRKASQWAAWLRQHAHLVKRLMMLLRDYRDLSGDGDESSSCWSDFINDITIDLQAASHSKPLVLQHFSLQGKPVTSELLAVLPVEHLTSLECEVPKLPPDYLVPATEDIEALWCDALDQISCLKQLRQLDISSGDTWPLLADAYEELADLQHLTKLQIGRSTVPQLEYLPPNLQQLQVEVEVNSSPELEEFAEWLQKQGHLLTELKIMSEWYNLGSDWTPTETSLQHLTRALQEAACRAGGQLQLQQLSVRIPFGSLVYKHLGNCCKLTALECMQYEWSPELLLVIGRMASLQKLTLIDDIHDGSEAVAHLDVNFLQPFSGLTCLSRLSLGGIDSAQLQFLPSSLKELRIETILPMSLEDTGFTLSHLAFLTKLQVPMLMQHDVLPVNVVHVEIGLEVGDAPSTLLSPLMQLQHLQQLDLKFGDQIPSEQLLALSTLCSLTNLRLAYCCDNELDALHFTVWKSLPLKSLSVITDEIPNALISALGSLHGLTDLRLDGDLCLSLDASSLIDVLSSLTNLRTFVFSGLVKCADDGEEDEDLRVQFVEALQDVTDALPHLQECYVGCVGAYY